MTRLPSPGFAALAGLLALAGCGSPGPVGENAQNAYALPDVGSQPPGPASDAGEVGAGNSASPAAAASPDGDIPSALRGRWALSPADCVLTTPSPSVLVVTDEALRFHEAVAKPVGDVDKSADFISGDFDFTGEGERWTRFQTLRLQDGQLIRTESSPMANYTYVRCTG